MLTPADQADTTRKEVPSKRNFLSYIFNPNVFTTVITIGFGLFLFNAELKSDLKEVSEKIDRLSEEREGILNFDQASALVKVYLERVQVRLHEEGIAFAKEHLQERQVNYGPSDTLPSGYKEALKGFVTVKTRQRIQNARSTVGVFKLKNGQSFIEFLDAVSPLNDGVIKAAQDKFLKEESNRNYLPTRKVFLESYKTAAGTAQSEANEKIDKALQLIYARSPL